jgi:hypothetical protein
MPKKKTISKEPAHGFCSVCKGPIPAGVNWTLTGAMFRVHEDPDDCIAQLDPEAFAKFKEANPKYISQERYIPGVHTFPFRRG